MVKTRPLSKTALEKARRMARHAAKKDNWLHACPEEELKNSTELTEIQMLHREHWEETTHFQVLYAKPLIDLAIGAAGLANREGYTGEAYYESHYIPLKDAFWDEWEEQVKFFEVAKQAMEAAGKANA